MHHTIYNEVIAKVTNVIACHLCVEFPASSVCTYVVHLLFEN